MKQTRRASVGQIAGLVALIAVLGWAYATVVFEVRLPWSGGGEPQELVPTTTTTRETAPEEGDQMADWIVSGAGSADYDGDYTYAGMHNGKPYYTKAAPVRYLCWDDPGPGNKWLLCEDIGDPAGSVGYSGTGADLPANPWSVEFGTPPAPTVAAGPTWGALDPIKAQEYIAPADTSIAAIRVYARQTAGGSGRVTGALYDASKDLIAVTREGLAGAGGGWVELQFSGTYPTLANGLTYYLAAWSPYAATEIRGTAGIPSDGGKCDISTPPPSYDAWPDPIQVEDIAGSYHLEAVVGADVVGGYHEGTYSVGDPDSPVAGGLLRAGYSVGICGSHEGGYSTGEGGEVKGAMSFGVSGSLRGARSVGEGGGLRSAYSAGPSLALEGRHRGGYSVGQELAGSLAAGYSIGEQASGRHRGAMSVGEARSGELRGAMSIGGTPPTDEFDVLDLIIIR